MAVLSEQEASNQTLFSTLWAIVGVLVASLGLYSTVRPTSQFEKTKVTLDEAWGAHKKALEKLETPDESGSRPMAGESNIDGKSRDSPLGNPARAPGIKITQDTRQLLKRKEEEIKSLGIQCEELQAELNKWSRTWREIPKSFTFTPKIYKIRQRLIRIRCDISRFEAMEVNVPAPVQIASSADPNATDALGAEAKTIGSVPQHGKSTMRWGVPFESVDVQPIIKPPLVQHDMSIVLASTSNTYNNVVSGNVVINYGSRIHGSRIARNDSAV